MLVKSIYDRIKESIDIHSERFGIASIRERKSYEFVGGKALLISIPKKEKIFYHGSSYEVDCDESNKKCNIEGGLVTKLGIGNEIKKKLENLSCDVLEIHNYDTLSVKSTHVHFRCNDKSYSDTLKIVKLFKEH